MFLYPGIARAVYVRQSRHKSIVQYAQLIRACIVQPAQFPTFQAISIFLQIRLDESNYHIFPPYFAQMKWKIDGSSGHKHERTLHFLHFSQQYTVHIMALREKNRPGFSHVRVRVKQNKNFPQ